MYCIGFNGPPRSGKDSSAKEIEYRFEQTVISTWTRSLSLPMRLVGFAMLGRPYSVEEYEEVKDQPHDVFNGQTFRRFMIRYSEEFIKPAYGQEAWAKSLLSGLGTGIHLPGLCLIPDIGFQPETDCLVDAFGEDRFLLIHLYRKGYEWGTDSRGYVTAPNQLALQNSRLVTLANLVLSQARSLGWDL